LDKQFINPNLHVAILHFPLALLVAGTLIELFAFLWRRSAFRAAGRWMILLGALTAAPVATSGLYALYDTNVTPETSPEARPDITWAEVRAGSPVTGHAWEMMKDHALWAAIASAAALLLVVLWLGASDVWRSRLHLVFLLLLVWSLAVMLTAAWHGGEMVYEHGVGVGRVQEHSQADENRPAGSSRHKIEYFLPPLQTHVILAGCAIAAAMVGIGLSLRAGAQARLLLEPTPELSDISAALNPQIRPRVPLAAGGTIGEPPIAGPGGYEQTATMRMTVQRQPVARFWLLAALIAIATGLAGWWTLAEGSGVWDPKGLWHQVIDPAKDGNPRRLAHGIATGAIVLLLLTQALVSRLAVGRRLVLTLFSMLLIAFLAAQLWFGSLLLFDSPLGKLERFNGTAAAAAPAPAPGAAPTTTPSLSTPPVTAPATTAPTAQR
jgi:uncharacterized membrane protein